MDLEENTVVPGPEQVEILARAWVKELYIGFYDRRFAGFFCLQVLITALFVTASSTGS